MFGRAFYAVARAIVLVIFSVLFRMKAYGRENVPMTGPLIICANHVSNFDSVMFGLLTRRKLRFMGKKELFENKALGTLIRALGVFPVDRASADLSSYKTALKLLKNNEALMLFVQGKREKEFDSAAGKTGAAFFAHKTGAKLLPACIESTYKLFSPVTITFGQPLSAGEGTGKQGLQNVTDEVMRKINELMSKDSNGSEA